MSPTPNDAAVSQHAPPQEDCGGFPRFCVDSPVASALLRWRRAAGLLGSTLKPTKQVDAATPPQGVCLPARTHACGGSECAKRARSGSTVHRAAHSAAAASV